MSSAIKFAVFTGSTSQYCTLPLSTFVDEAPRIRLLTERAGLRMPGVGSYALCHEIDAAEQVLHGAALLGAPSVRIRLPKYHGREHIRVVRERARDQFRQVQGLARRYGVSGGTLRGRRCEPVSPTFRPSSKR